MAITRIMAYLVTKDRKASFRMYLRALPGPPAPQSREAWVKAEIKQTDGRRVPHREPTQMHLFHSPPQDA